jgi:hypothetical protein
MDYYKQGDAAKVNQIKAAFEQLGYDISWPEGCANPDVINIGVERNGAKYVVAETAAYIRDIIKTHQDYKELELPVEPKFKAEDRIVSKSDRSTIYRIITLHEERREYIVEIEHKDFHESCPWIAFEDQDDFELAPKKHYDISNFKVGMPVLVRADNVCRWDYSVFSRITGYEDWKFAVCNGVNVAQCIPFEENEHLLGTTDMPSEEFINW